MVLCPLRPLQPPVGAPPIVSAAALELQPTQSGGADIMLWASLSASPTVGSSAGKPCGVHLSSGRQGDNGWVVCMWKRGSDEKSLRRTLSACHSRSHDIVSRLQHAAEHSHHSATPVRGASLALPYHSRRRPGVAPRATKEHDYRGAGGGECCLFVCRGQVICTHSLFAAGRTASAKDVVARAASHTEPRTSRSCISVSFLSHPSPPTGCSNYGGV